MSQTFVPFAPISSKNEGVFTPVPWQDASQLPTSLKSLSATEMNGVKVHAPETCSAPVITLKRTGDVVSAIQIQCACGQVIELNCVY